MQTAVPAPLASLCESYLSAPSLLLESMIVDTLNMTLRSAGHAIVRNAFLDQFHATTSRLRVFHEHDACMTIDLERMVIVGMEPQKNTCQTRAS